MKELMQEKYFLKPGKVLLKYKVRLKTEEERGKYEKPGAVAKVNQYMEVVAIANNVTNFKKDFPVSVGDKVIIVAHGISSQFIIDEYYYIIKDASQIGMVFKENWKI